MLSKQRKQDLKSNGSYDLAKQIQYCQRYDVPFCDLKTGDVLLDKAQANELSWLLSNDQDHKDALKLIHSENSKYNRLLKRIFKYIDMGQCLFLTLTFRDEVLSATSKETRRKYVRRFLRKFSNAFVGNIDYGKKTSREHYHALIVYDDPEMLKEWVYGFSSAKYVFDSKESLERITRYILKLTNHFVKESTGNERLIYSVYRDYWKEPDFKDYRFEKIENGQFNTGENKFNIKVSKTENIHLDNEQMTFWNGQVGNYSNFDIEDYLT